MRRNWLIALFVLSVACASDITEEEREYRDAERGIALIEEQRRCLSDLNCVWYCVFSGAEDPDMKEPTNAAELARWWRNYGRACGPARKR